MDKNMLFEELKNKLEAEQKKARSAWDKGVYSYALEMIENINGDQTMKKDQVVENHDLSDFLNHVDGRGLNMGAFWTVDDRIKARRIAEAASWGGNFDIYDGDIVERLCTPGEIKRYNSGRMQNGPNCRERWMDVQARAINKAVWEIHFILRHP